MNKYNNMEVNINTDMLKNRGKKGKKGQAETAEMGGDDNYQQQYWVLWIKLIVLYTSMWWSNLRLSRIKA